MPDENRVFDVSRPSKVSPPPTSKPVIVGHHPLNDPMVTGDNMGSGVSTPATKIPINDEADHDDPVTVEQAMAAHQAAEGTSSQEEPQGSPAIFSDHDSDDDQSEPPAQIIHPTQSLGEGPFTAVEPDQSIAPTAVLPTAAPHEEPHIEGLHFAQPRPKRSRLKWAIGGILVLLIAAYLAIDSGLVNAGISLPFHIFKQKSQTTSTPSTPPTQQPAATGPTIPDGFKEYKLAETNLTFAAPLAWGDPTSTTDPGYSKRTTGAQSDGTFAYLVNFATNKDIQIAVTSAKYLSTPRTPTYYDYLQWCVGTNDSQIYESILNFSTTNKVDTPTTITCNQGPVPNALKLNSTTVVQAQAKDTTGKVIGDIYTMNLKDPTLVVLRVKDAAMTNGTDIKQLLNTVQLTSTSSSTSSSNSSSSASSSSSGQ